MGILSELKRKSEETKQKFKEEIEGFSKKTRPVDERFWKPTVDKAGNGSAIIRFLPPPINEDKAFVRYFDYFFKGPGGWYTEKCRTTLGPEERDPSYEYTGQLWADKKEDQARKQGRRTHFVSNILVLNDPGKPENNGKVFLFQYGKKIMETKIMPVFKPDEELGEEAGDPFNFWKEHGGRNFKLKVKRVGDFPNYDESGFATPSTLLDGDERKLEEVYRQQYSLSEFTDPKNFKSYEELEKRLQQVLFGSPKVKTPSESLIRPNVSQETKKAVFDMEEEVSNDDINAATDDDDVDIQSLINSMK